MTRTPAIAAPIAAFDIVGRDQPVVTLATTNGDAVAASVTPQQMGAFSRTLLGWIVDYASAQTNRQRSAQDISSDGPFPIAIQEVEVAVDWSETVALLVCRVGDLKLALEFTVESLLGVCETIRPTGGTPN